MSTALRNNYTLFEDFFNTLSGFSVVDNGNKLTIRYKNKTISKFSVLFSSILKDEPEKYWCLQERWPYSINDNRTMKTNKLTMDLKKDVFLETSDFKCLKALRHLVSSKKRKLGELEGLLEEEEDQDEDEDQEGEGEMEKKKVPPAQGLSQISPLCSGEGMDQDSFEGFDSFIKETFLDDVIQTDKGSSDGSFVNVDPGHKNHDDFHGTESFSDKKETDESFDTDENEDGKGDVADEKEGEIYSNLGDVTHENVPPLSQHVKEDVINPNLGDATHENVASFPQHEKGDGGDVTQEKPSLSLSTIEANLHNDIRALKEDIDKKESVIQKCHEIQKGLFLQVNSMKEQLLEMDVSNPQIYDYFDEHKHEKVKRQLISVYLTGKEYWKFV